MAASEKQERRVTWAGGWCWLGPLRPGLQLRPGGGLGRMLRAGMLPLIGNGAAMFSFIHAHDVATAILAAIDHPTARRCSTSSTTSPPRPTTGCPRWRPCSAARLACPAWLARLLVGEWGVAYMTGLAGAANTRAATGCTGSPPTAAGGTA